MDLSGIDEMLIVLLLQSDVVVVVQILCTAPPALRVGAVAFFDSIDLYWNEAEFRLNGPKSGPSAGFQLNGANLPLAQGNRPVDLLSL